jgi:hypothetical protein
MSQLCKNSLKKGLKFVVGAHLIANRLEKPLDCGDFGLLVGWRILLHKM